MPASKVYFTDFRCRNGVSQLDKLRKLLENQSFPRSTLTASSSPSSCTSVSSATCRSCVRTMPRSSPILSKNAAAGPSSPTATRSMSAAAKRARAYGHRLLKRLFPVLHRLSRYHRRRPEGLGRYRGSRRGRRILQDRPYRPGRDGRGYRDLTGALQGP